jgi:hypothetical protein
MKRRIGFAFAAAAIGLRHGRLSVGGRLFASRTRNAPDHCRCRRLRLSVFDAEHDSARLSLRIRRIRSGLRRVFMLLGSNKKTHCGVWKFSADRAGQRWPRAQLAPPPSAAPIMLVSLS